MVKNVNKKTKYEPTEKEEFMNPKQIDYFKTLLLSWKQEILKESSNTLDHLKEESSNKPDNADRASIESERSLELRTRDRERKLLNKINKALRKIDDGTYGYCEETNKPISIARLKARPIATLSIEAKILEKSELLNKKIRDANLPEDIRIGAIVRKEQVVIPGSNFIFEKNDLVVFLAKREQLKEVESIFSVSSI